MAHALPEIAFYYPGHLWRSGEWIKTLLLFFDGIGLLVPEYKQGEPEQFDPVIAGPLRDKGLLHYLIADEAVDRAATERMAEAVLGLVSIGALDHLSRDGTAFHQISMSRMGYYGHRDLAENLYSALASRGLAKPSEDGVSVPLHPLVRYLILVLLAQVLREKGRERNLELSPTTDRPEILQALKEVLDLPTNASVGRIVEFDLQTVSVDLASVPLDEVLSFREEHGVAFRQYSRSVRQFSRDLSLLRANEREAAFNDRQSELDDLASGLKRAGRMAWKRPATFALGLAGATWTAVTGDWIGAMLGAGAVVVGETGGSSELGAYSYLFSARDHFRR